MLIEANRFIIKTVEQSFAVQLCFCRWPRQTQARSQAETTAARDRAEPFCAFSPEAGYVAERLQRPGQNALDSAFAGAGPAPATTRPGSTRWALPMTLAGKRRAFFHRDDALAVTLPSSDAFR